MEVYKFEKKCRSCKELFGTDYAGAEECLRCSRKKKKKRKRERNKFKKKGIGMKTY